jgi:hypothetical protein
MRGAALSPPSHRRCCGRRRGQHVLSRSWVALGCCRGTDSPGPVLVVEPTVIAAEMHGDTSGVLQRARLYESVRLAVVALSLSLWNHQ